MNNTFMLESDFGRYEIWLEKQLYHNGNLAIELWCYDFGMPSPYVSLTVNFDEKLPDDYAYVDTNNFPKAEEFIEKHGLGVKTGKYRHSRYCSYPLYKFNI